MIRDVNIVEERTGMVAKILAAGAVLLSAVHFWPWEESRVWQAINLSNLGLLLWCPVLVYAMVRRQEYFKSILPHTSVWAYLVIVFLSAAFAGSAGRGISFSVKMGLTFVAGYTVVCTAARDVKSLGLIYNIAFAAGAISVATACVTRLGMSSEEFGFHGSAYKYGTYIGMLVPLAACYFFFSGSSIKKLLACGLVVAGLASAGTLGAAALVAGVAATMAVAKRSDVRLAGAMSLIVGLGLVAAMNGAVKEDLTLKEAESADLRQRYIEWQAEMNILEKRSVVGSGAGSVNDYRSNFYYQLPKLNTLAAFDQNGWLAAAAETGVIGLLCFCWIIAEYGKRAAALLPRNGAAAFGVSGIAGIVGACIANVFSSVNYNGVLIVFVLVLALVAASCRICEEGEL